MTTNFYQEDLEYFANRYEKGKNSFKTAVAEDSFVEASRFIADSIKWKRHQRFAQSFNIDKLDENIERLHDRILEASTIRNSVIGEAIKDTANQEADREQYAFCLKLKKIIAKRNAQ